MRRPQFLKRLTTLAVLFSLCLALVVSTNTKVRAVSSDDLLNLPSSKISPDLRKLIESGGGNSRVRVIVQSTPVASGGLIGSLLNLVAGIVVATLSNLNIKLVDIQANSADALAEDPSVAYISLDAPVHSSGHVTTTTGAQQSTAQKGVLDLPNTLEGSVIAIAILDSGIDAQHRSFTAVSAKIKANKDFTGENRPDDPYG